MQLWNILLIQHVYAIEVILDIDFEKVIFQVEKEFLSLTFDASYFKSQSYLADFKSKKLLTLAKALSSEGEFYLRFGGTSKDSINFKTNEIYFDKTEFDVLVNFVNEAKWKLIFGLNVLNRYPDGNWNSSNAKHLLKYIVDMNYNVIFGLGNEFDLFPDHLNITITPEQLAVDFKMLRKILDEVFIQKQIKLFGPDVATLNRNNFFETFLKSIDEGILDGVTFHHYYSSSDDLNPENFTQIKYLDSFIDYGFKAISIVKKSLSHWYKFPQVWIRETSSTYGGGSKSAGNSFAAGFLWLDKLGLAAQMGISVVLRQSFKGGNYSLVDAKFNPTPDYWSSLLYKRLVGQKVLKLTGFLEHGRDIRMYAHCTNVKNGAYKSGSVVLIVININAKENATINFKNNTVSVDQYLLTPSNGNIADEMVSLNGHILTMNNETTLPVLNPIKSNFPLYMPPLSYGFFVLTNSNAKVC
ncbi:heparanase-like [Hydra vulgaris]|uniref:heparanase-like n=1 Tax=Hydra vulgaris TaxID=6087 RepID=UPI001F5FC267|nr:heparanase-like [Hydra vulgaris]